jgi:hypothetical protein
VKTRTTLITSTVIVVTALTTLVPVYEVVGYAYHPLFGLIAVTEERLVPRTILVAKEEAVYDVIVEVVRDPYEELLDAILGFAPTECLPYDFPRDARLFCVNGREGAGRRY